MSLYLEAHQTRSAEPTVYEDLLADAIESAYAAGVQDLDGLVARLNLACVPTPNGVDWTAELLKAELARLGA
jgi:hypothetical protein